MPQFLRFAAILLLGLFLIEPVMAQHVPEDFPGRPTDDKGERHERQMKERFRDFISRLYTSTSIAFEPSSRGLFDPVAYQAAGGLRFHNGDALHTAFEVRQYEAFNGSHLPWEQDRAFQTVYASTLSYDVSLNHVTDHPLLKDRAAVGLGGGFVYGEHQMLTLEVTPKYVIPVSERWSLPLGLNLSTALIHAAGESIQTSFVGLHVGVRMYLGRRDYLE